MANCQDLIDKLEEIRLQQQTHNEREVEFFDFVQERLPALDIIGEQLNQRLVHRDFIAQGFRDIQAGIANSCDAIAARVAQVTQALTGTVATANTVPENPLTDLGLNQDTSGAGGEGGGEGGGS